MIESSIDLVLFGEDNINFLENKMWLDLKDIQKKIEKDASLDKDYFLAIFDWMVLKFNYFSNEYKKNDNDMLAKNHITDILNTEFVKINETYNIKESTEAYIIGDLLRCFFIQFSMGGIEQAYKSSETGDWYPKIIFKERIESDINCLDLNLIIYRGTSEKEFESKKFGQSWSLDKSIASEFAFTHYADSPDYLGTMRVILEVKISREDVLYYNQDELECYGEEEVVVDSEKLKNTILIEKKILKERD